MKFIALLRTKNSDIKLEDCLTRLSSLADEIIIMDNGSTDRSIEICKKFPKVTLILRDDTNNFHEGRDMNILLEEAKKRQADWITMAWPDEIFEDHFTREVLEKYMRGKHDKISFRMCNFWLSTKYCRFDREWFRYNLLPQRTIWRNLEGTYFNDIKIHPGSIQGIPSKDHISPYRIKHYGYAFQKDVEEKIHTYRRLDPGTEKYDSIATPLKDIYRYPFHEFKNKTINYFYIISYSFICKILLLLLTLKRKVR